VTDRPIRRTHAARTGAALVCVAALALVASACSVTGFPGSSPTASTSPTAPATTPPAPGAAHSSVRVSFLPGSGVRGVRPDTLVRLTATDGRLTSVVVRPLHGGTAVKGHLTADGTQWVAQKPASLAYGTTYAVDVQAVDPAGQGRVLRSTFSTVKPKALLQTIVTPGSGDVVGVGLPIMVRFTEPVTDRATVERHLKVTTSRPVVGSWHWFGDDEVHFRPKTYWPANTNVRVDFDLAGVNAGGGVWGDHDRTVRFSTGDALVSTVDVRSDHMTVTRNGKVLRVIPITTGKPGYLTRGGIKIIVTKERYRVMDSTTVDIPKNSPDAYHLKVEYAMRLTWSGEFLHAAPWSVRHQGHENVSHGCTGMSTDNAAWLYSISHIGDVVQYVNSTRPLELGNGYTDWNISWSAWQAGSAL
jgi:lipoprotein-anchoring transpeptidase ErfK/SrfK